MTTLQVLGANPAMRRAGLERNPAWIYDVAPNEELDTLLAQASVYNLDSYQIHPLAEVRGPGPIGTK